MWNAWMGERRKDQSLSRLLSTACPLLPTNLIRFCGDTLPTCKHDPCKRLFSVCGSCKPSHYLHWIAELRSRAEELDTGDRWVIRTWFLPPPQMKAENSAAICSIRIFIACRCSWKYMRIPWGSQILEGIIVHLEICPAKCGICFLLLFAVRSFLVTMHYSWLYL